ncbi:MAG: hypothetical protein WDO15_28285 [Bacteroidota bacterium]
MNGVATTSKFSVYELFVVELFNYILYANGNARRLHYGKRGPERCEMSELGGGNIYYYAGPETLTKLEEYLYVEEGYNHFGKPPTIILTPPHEFAAQFILKQ